MTLLKPNRDDRSEEQLHVLPNYRLAERNPAFDFDFGEPEKAPGVQYLRE